MADAKPNQQALSDGRPNEASGLVFILMVLLLLTVVVALTA